jgi:plastocyanin
MRRLVTLSLAIAGFALAGLVSPRVTVAGDPCFHSMDRPPVSAGSTDHIAIADCTFGPTITYVDVGSQVVWRNASSQEHEVVGSNLTWGAHDKLLQPGDSIGWSFDAAGVYPYSCMIHPGMTGAIVVGDGGGSATRAGLDATEEPVIETTGGDSATAPTSRGGDTSVPFGVAVGAGTVIAAAAVVVVLRSRRTSIG